MKYKMYYGTVEGINNALKEIKSVCRKHIKENLSAYLRSFLIELNEKDYIVSLHQLSTRYKETHKLRLVFEVYIYDGMFYIHPQINYSSDLFEKFFENIFEELAQSVYMEAENLSDNEELAGRLFDIKMESIATIIIVMGETPYHFAPDTIELNLIIDEAAENYLKEKEDG